jgi:two-component system cell cycle sensor histidine kinase/response regulator CckA
MVQLYLEQQGYSVLLAATGEEGLVRWRRQGASIRLVPTNMVMPGPLSGPEFARVVRRERPGLPVIFMGGYSPDLSDGNLNLHEGVNYLPKPLSLQRLAGRVAARLQVKKLNGNCEAPRAFNPAP